MLFSSVYLLDSAEQHSLHFQVSFNNLPGNIAMYLFSLLALLLQAIYIHEHRMYTQQKHTLNTDGILYRIHYRLRRNGYNNVMAVQPVTDTV